MAKLAQTYIHLKVQASERQLNEAREYLEYTSALYALKYFSEDVYIELQIEEGSLRIWTTVIGGLYVFVCGYGDFRDGIDHLVEDARSFSNNVIQCVQNETNVSKDEFYRAERRLGVPGQIQRLLPVLDEANELIKKKKDGIALEKIDYVQRQLRHIATELDEEEDKEILNLFSKNMPEHSCYPFKYPPSPIPAPIYDAQTMIATNKRPIRKKPRELIQKYNRPPKPPKFN